MSVPASPLMAKLPRREWLACRPGELIRRGHCAGDFLEAYKWVVTEEAEGFLRIRAHVPARLKNLRGQLFGGFTPTYIDLVALHTVWAGPQRFLPHPRPWLATTNMQVDYSDPIVGPEFVIESRLVKRRGRTNFVETRFFDPEETLAVLATITMRELEINRVLGDV